MAVMLAGLSAMAIGHRPPVQSINTGPNLQADEAPMRRRGGKGQNNKRGKGPRSKPKARPNRLIVSKRVRRKHRRRSV